MKAITTTINDDPTVRDLRTRRAPLTQERAAAVARRNAATPQGKGPIPFSLEFLQADGDVQRLDAALTALDAEISAAVESARAGTAAARTVERAPFLRAKRDALEAVRVAAVALEAFDQATASALGIAPGPTVGPSSSALIGSVRDIERAITPPVKAKRPAPEKGYQRVRVVEPFIDRDAIAQWRSAGEVVDLANEAAKQALTAGWAVKV
jgi:hypothetical protein